MLITSVPLQTIQQIINCLNAAKSSSPLSPSCSSVYNVNFV